MSAAAAAEAAEVPVKKKGGKKLVLILAIVGVLLAGGGGAAVFLMKKKAAEAAAAEEGGEEQAAEASHDEPKKKEAGHPPAFLPLEPFVVNLADRDSERYAQIGVTLQVDDPKVAEELKAYMPAIRNGVLMILAHKTSAELLQREGKVKLAAEIMRESVRPLGIEIEEEEEAPAAGAHADEADDVKAKPAKKPKKRKPPVHNPVEHVHFSSFIIQ